MSMPVANLVTQQCIAGHPVLGSECGRYFFTHLGVLAGFGPDPYGSQHEGVKALFAVLKELKPTQFLAVDCDTLDILGGEISRLDDLLKVMPTLVVRNCSRNLSDKFPSNLAGYDEMLAVPRHVLRDGSEDILDDAEQNYDFMFPAKKLASDEISSGAKSALNLEATFLRSRIGQTAINQDIDSGRLKSTQLRSNYYFDINGILGDHAAYIWLIAKLSVELLALIEAVRARPAESHFNKLPRILACTRNGAAIASGIQAFLMPRHAGDLRIDVVERFGPLQRMIEEYHGGACEAPTGPEWYVYVGDFTIAGSEIKTAEAHAHHRGVPLLAGLVVGSVLPILTRDDVDRRGVEQAILNRFSIYSLVDMSALKLKPALEYQFP